MKIYKDGEYTKDKKCFNCESEKGIFYDKEFDAFTCEKCLQELNEKIRK